MKATFFQLRKTPFFYLKLPLRGRVCEPSAVVNSSPSGSGHGEEEVEAFLMFPEDDDSDLDER
jgi:hypothetical protein